VGRQFAGADFPPGFLTVFNPFIDRKAVRDMKKVLWALGAIVALIVVLVVAAGVIVYMTVTKDFVASKMSAALNRHVTIESIDVNLFSVVSGIEVKNVAISNFKTPDQLAALAGKPVPAGDLFAGVESFRFKLKFLPLLKRQVELDELTLTSPVINLSKNRQGVLNIDDLIKSKKQPAPEEKKAPAEPSKPLSADDLPVAVSIGEIGMRNATVNYDDAALGHRFQIYNLTALAHDIEIDPKALESKDQAGVKFGMGAKTVGPLKTGSVQNFDVKLDVTGKVIPFDRQSRLLNPEALVHVGLPEGEITGLQIFNAVAQIPVLGEYLGEYIAFLKDTQKWSGSKNSGLDLRYKDNQADISNGRLDLEQASITFDGGMNLASSAVKMNLGVVMDQATNDKVQALLTQKIDQAIKDPKVKQYARPEMLAQTAMKPLLNSDDRIELGAAVAGTTQKPAVTLTRPQLGSLSVIIKDAAGDVAVEAAKDVVKEKAKEYLKEDQKKLLDDVGGLLKKR